MSIVTAAPPSSPHPISIPHPARFRSLKRLAHNIPAMVALGFLVLVTLAALFAPLLTSIDPNKQDLLNKLARPSSEHWFGTDGLGRDIYSRILYGARVTMSSALQAILVAAPIGLLLGLMSGFLRGWTSRVLNAVSDAIMSIPPLLLAVVIVGVLGPGLTNAMLAVGVVLAPRFFRVAQAATESISHETYIEAATAAGCSTWRLMWRHVLPNASGPLLVQVSFGIGLAIAAEASLSFLGLGVQDPQASWGSMVKYAFQDIYTDWWSLVPPSLAIALTVLAFSVLGDGIRDAMGRERATR